MALQITQGPLPYDGERVDPSVFLAAWINNTTVANLPGGAFTGGSAQFVVSQTDAPPIAERTVGLLWFARGEGRLYKWDKPDLPSGLTYSTADWVPMSDRRVLWGRAVTDVALGAMVTFATPSAASNMPFMTATEAANEDSIPRPIWAFATGSAASGAVAGNPYNNKISPSNFISYETALSGTLFRAIELGFCTALMQSAETGRAGAVCVDDTRLWGFVMVEPTAGSACPFMPIAEAVDSSATAPGTPWLRGVFKHVMPMIGTAAGA